MTESIVLHDPTMVAIVQERSGAEFGPGDRVRVLSDGYATRVTR